jgi:hypothetical protein
LGRALDDLLLSAKGPLLDLAKVALEPAEDAEMLFVTRQIEWMVGVHHGSPRVKISNHTLTHENK